MAVEIGVAVATVVDKRAEIAKHEDWPCGKGAGKKRHVCNQYVNNKGKNGRCEGKHPYYQCTNPAKCSREEAAALD